MANGYSDTNHPHGPASKEMFDYEGRCLWCKDRSKLADLRTKLKEAQEKAKEHEDCPDLDMNAECPLVNQEVSAREQAQEERDDYKRLSDRLKRTRDEWFGFWHTAEAERDAAIERWHKDVGRAWQSRNLFATMREADVSYWTTRAEAAERDAKEKEALLRRGLTWRGLTLDSKFQRWVTDVDALLTPAQEEAPE